MRWMRSVGLAPVNYVDDFARYEAANAEYNRNEQTLAKLEATRDAERAEEEQAHNIDAV